MTDCGALIGIAEIANGIEPGSWTVVSCIEERQDQAANELEEELRFAFADSDRQVIPVDASDLESFFHAMSDARAADVVLVKAADQLDAHAWHQLDGARTRFEGGPGVVFILSEHGLERLATHAPHLWSWLTSRVFSVDHQVGRLDVEARLESLRAGTGLTDEEVIRRAQAGELAADPVYAEWLMLLGKGELIGD